MIAQPRIDEERCRLCAGQLTPVFSRTVLGQFDVRYFRCQRCNCLQTEPPFWLAEAYASAVSTSDTGYVRRNLEVVDAALFLRAVLRLGNAGHILDYGSGLGIAARALQEMGVSASAIDAYYSSPFPGLDWKGQPVRLLVASEVLEHFANPITDLRGIFGLAPRYIYTRTTLYRGQSHDWEYLGPEHGQHVFFYSPNGMGHIARKFGYQVMLIGEGQQFFWQGHLPAVRRGLINVGLRNRSRSLLRFFGSTFRVPATAEV